ncbi:MAG: SUMF1/EgtB/PvdO family nonheme iron enzyme [Verrucomicrobiales bacterium]
MSFDWATVVDPENFADPTDGDAFSEGVQHFGAVDHAYRIALHEVTNAQYAEFLNAVDPGGSNASGLYSSAMGNTVRGGINLVPANAGGAKYVVKPNMAHKPVNHVSWSDAARFANWMNNGQGGAGTTESGAYDMALPNPVRLAGATFFLPSEDEWYKAAYFDPVNVVYSKYPTMSDQPPVVGQASTTGDIANPGPNVANYSCGAEWNGDGCNLTTVGSATSKSFYGAFDMAGNVWEWNESSPNRSRGVRGGGARFTTDFLDSSARGIPAMGDYDDVIGFRIARLPSDISGFTETPVPGLPGLLYGSLAWGDYNNDGRLDFMMSGASRQDLAAGSATSQLWRNTGDGFVQVPVPGLPGVRHSDIAWGDYDNDGWLDFLISGAKSERQVLSELVVERVTQLWRNLEGNGFAPVPIEGLAQVQYGSAAWGDYDNDGRLDFMITGETGWDGEGEYTVQLWRNTGTGFANVPPPPGLHGVGVGSLDWIDFDRDGLLDFSITGTNIGRGAAGGNSELWRNIGNGFVKVPIEGLPGVVFGSMSWCDYDNDGWLDFLLTGTAWMVIIDRPDPLPDAWDYVNLAQLWRNTGTGFAKIPTPGLPGIQHSVAWGDYDNDGRSDLLVSGYIDINRPNQFAPTRSATTIWRNTGSGFAEVPAGLEEVTGSTEWGDYDNDGRLDILFSGGDGFSTTTPFTARLLRNSAAAANLPPSAPTGLDAHVTNNRVTLSWLPASDDHTPATGLSYNLVLSSTPSGLDLVSPMANLTTGFRRVVQLGSANLRTSWTFTNLPPASVYYWSVQAVDSAFAGGLFAMPPSDMFPVVITSITRPNPGQARIAFAGITRQIYNVERSEDLAVWRVIGVGTESPVGSGLYTFLDTDLTADARYYRIAPVRNIPGFAYIPPGPFIMGNSIDDPDITDAHAVSVTVSAFYMGQTEVTTAQWNEVATWAASHGYAGLRQGGGAGNSPMMMVDWFHALVWCNARSEKEGKIPAYYTDEAYTSVYRGGVPGVLNGALPVFANWNTTGYRLPTEAEWEKAARGGLSRQRFPWHATISHSQANYFSDPAYAYDISPTRGFHPEFADQLPQGFPIAPVRHFQSNGYSLHEMAGNLFEWCWDLYQTRYTAGAIDPRGATTGFRRIYRGGSWGSHADDCRAAARSSREPWTDLPDWVNNSQFFGLRVVLPLE